MKKIPLLLIGLLTFAASAIAQNIEYKSQATSLVGGRYEIIMSDVALRNSFKVLLLITPFFLIK